MSEENKKNNMDIIQYRLDAFEKNLNTNMSSLSSKLDTLLTKIGESEVTQENFRIRLGAIETEIRALKKEDAGISEEITKLKVSVAEKLSWSAGGGVVATILSKVLGGM